LDFSGGEAAAKVAVAVLALFGSLFGTTVTLIGLLLKRSIDKRTLVLQTEAEQRLKLDTAIKAVELFKSAAGAASPAESAGALFALIRLGQFDFALSLLDELWPKDLVRSPSAVWVINCCLQSEDVEIAELAATLLWANAAKLPDDHGGKSWPANYDWQVPNTMSLLTRRLLLMARVKSLLSRPFDYWDRNILNADILALSNSFRTDSSSELTQSAAAYLRTLLQVYDPSDKQVLHLPTGLLSIEEVRAEIEKKYGASVCGSTASDEELEGQLRSWVRPAAFRQASRPGEASGGV
jgi:hypothetical protein